MQKIDTLRLGKNDTLLVYVDIEGLTQADALTYVPKMAKGIGKAIHRTPVVVVTKGGIPSVEIKKIEVK